VAVKNLRMPGTGKKGKNRKAGTEIRSEEKEIQRRREKREILRERGRKRDRKLPIIAP
jgi:hypothetical protein